MERKKYGEKKKTKKEIAEDLHMNLKTMRAKAKYVDDLEMICQNLGDDGKKFEEILEHLERNKKRKISNAQLATLARLPPELQKDICKKIIAHPQNAKKVINTWIDTPIKTTIEIPASVNEWLVDQAERYGLSKGKYIAAMLINLYNKENRE